MKKKFIRDISSSSFQMIINQISGLVTFYIISTFLTKQNFGEISWALAIFVTAFNILSFGIDNVAIRKIASGSDPVILLSIYIWHVTFSGIFFFGLLFLLRVLFPDFFLQHHLLFWLGLSRLMIFFTTPFKQVAAGKEKFKLLMWMSMTSNLLRGLGLILLAILNVVNVNTTLGIFILSSFAELLVCLFITLRYLKFPIHIKWIRNEYLTLVKESLPQLGVVIFDAAIARFDWIFLGLLASTIVLADYSFAYKIFEVSTLPLLIVAPLLIPRFTKLFQGSLVNATSKINDLLIFFRLEMIIASFIALVLNLTWVPVIDFITNDKYGIVNSQTILILSASMPFLYLNNFLWTINFAQGRLKMIFIIVTITFFVNIAGDIIMIPNLKAEGAAIAYSSAIAIQTIFYLLKTEFKEMKSVWHSLLMCPFCAIASALITTRFVNDSWLGLLLSIFIYIIALFITRQIRIKDWVVFKEVIGI